MTLKDIKMKVFELIEEIDTDNEALTSDPDLAAKINSVINSKQYELARLKKIPTIDKAKVSEKELEFDLEELDNFYQLDRIKFNGKLVPFNIFGKYVIFEEAGEYTFYYYKYPKAITEETKDDYKFELSDDVLEILPYGVAADILASDVSSGYGNIYRNLYETMIQRLDSRYAQTQIVLGTGDDTYGIL